MSMTTEQAAEVARLEEETRDKVTEFFVKCSVVEPEPVKKKLKEKILKLKKKY